MAITVGIVGVVMLVRYGRSRGWNGGMNVLRSSKCGMRSRAGNRLDRGSRLAKAVGCVSASGVDTASWPKTSNARAEGLARAAARFVPDATRAIWDGEVLTVTFREEGLIADAETTVSITGEAAADAVCTKNDEVLFSLHSHSAVADESIYRAGADGVADSTVILRLTAQVAALNGLDGAMSVNHSFSVTVRDLDTGAELFISGQARPRGEHG